MAVAWIAWRDIKLVRENCPGFRSASTLWVFREWNELVDEGTSFKRREGWFLGIWSEATTVRLSLLEMSLKARDKLPASSRMPVPEAEKGLWRALSDGHLVAEALSRDGLPVDIPQREWSYLKLFEDGKRDVLRYDVLDRGEPFTEVKLRRDDLLRLWPESSQRAAIPTDGTHLVEPFMLEPMANPVPTGYVPLCAALHWIMTSGGMRPVAMDDETAWTASVEKLFPLICGGDIELIGLPCGQPLTERIPGHALTLVSVLTTASRTAWRYPAQFAVTYRLLSVPGRRALDPRLQRQALPEWPRLCGMDAFAGPKSRCAEPVVEARAHGKVSTRRLPLASSSNAAVSDDQDPIKGSDLGRGRTEIPAAFRASISTARGIRRLLRVARIFGPKLADHHRISALTELRLPAYSPAGPSARL
jgi:hypothetical protein